MRSFSNAAYRSARARSNGAGRCPIPCREILAILNSDRPLAEILQHIVVQASLLLQADASAIYQVQDAETAIFIQANCGLSREQLDNPFQLTLPAAGNQVAENGEPAAIAAAAGGDDALVNNSNAPHMYCAQLAVPLRIKDDVYGGLMLYYTEPRKFSDEEIELAVMFGDQAVLAIENARPARPAERTAVAAERNRIARDLHDSVTQTLFSATLIAEVLPRLVERNGSEGMRRLEELRQLTRGALAEMRTLLLELRPATLIEVSIEELLRQLTEAARGRARIPIELQVQVTAPLPPDVKVALYYIAQEALNNVAKHARAGSAYVNLASHAQGAVLSIVDDGQGFDLPQVTPEHLGLAIMRERSEAINGELTIGSAPGEGTEITIRWANPEMAGVV